MKKMGGAAVGIQNVEGSNKTRLGLVLRSLGRDFSKR